MTQATKQILDSLTDPTDALRALRLQINLRDLVKQFTENADALAKLAASTQKHDNGFDKIVLCSSASTGLKLVLHLWHADGITDEDNIHDHRWDFASVVLRGQLQCDIYQLEPTGDHYSTFSYESSGGAETYVFRPTGTTTAVKRVALTIASSSTYTWGHPILHRAYAIASSATATIVVQGPPVRTATRVLLRARRPMQAHNSVQRLGTPELTRVIGILDDPDIQHAWQHVSHG